jgi:hypothetical protein
MREAGDDPAKQVRVLYRIALAREPDRKELDHFLAFLQKQRERHSSVEGAGLAALTDLAHVMLNANEFVYIN